MSDKRKLYAKLDDLTITSNKKDIFSFGRPPNAKIDNLVMKPPKVLPYQWFADTLSQEKKSTDTLSQEKKSTYTLSEEKKSTDTLSEEKKSTDTLSQERKLTDTDECDELSEKELLECLSILQGLEKKEEELKIAILYEKLKKEERVSDQSLTKENINQLQQKLEQTKENLKMRQVYNSKKHQTEILRRILQPPAFKNKSKAEVFEYSDEAKTLILNLMSERKQKEKEIDLLQKQIKEAEEIYLHLRTKIDDFTSTPRKPKRITSTDKELKHLKEENSKRSSRIQLLSNITKTLIDNISIQDNLKDDLKLLSLSCENILNWNYEDLDELKELCKMVYSTEI